MCTIVLLITGALALDSCGREKQPEINRKLVEQRIEASISDQLLVNATVRCAKNVPIKKGKTFECTVKGTGSPASPSIPFTARQRDTKGRVTWKLNAMPTFKLRETIAKQILAQRKISVTLDCPELVPQVKGTKFDCIARDGTGAASTVHVVLTDDEGSSDWSV